MSIEIVVVHNVWTVYGLNPDGSEVEQPIAQMSRPQDWGDKKRWHYERFCFEWIQETHHYINYVHCWTDLKLEQRGEYPMLFAQFIVQITMPGANPYLCGMDYLDEDDFWLREWGAMPPYYEEDEEQEDEET